MPTGKYTRDPIAKTGAVRPIIFPIGPSIAYIQLTCGQFSLIDADDMEKASITNWFATWSAFTESFYAQGNIRVTRQRTYLHRVIMNHPQRPMVVDHFNFNTLDNRKANLNLIPQSENVRRRRKYKRGG